MSVRDTDPVIPTRTVVLRDGRKPVQVSATVVEIARRAETGILGPVVGLDAHVRVAFARGGVRRTLFVSRLVGEPHWVIDAKFGGNAFPFFSNGFGARARHLRGVPRELEALLDQAAQLRELVERIGPNLPLVLAGEAASEDPTGTGVAS